MNRLSKSLFCVALLASASAAIAQDTGDRITASFSDPSRPGVLHVQLLTGSIAIKAGEGKDVIIQARGEGARHFREPEPPPPGLKRISQQPGLSVEEKDNRMQISSSSVMLPVYLEIQVPAHTNLEVSIVNGGDVKIEGVDGEIEAGNVNGSIILTNVSGSVVAHAVNGKLIADLARVTPQKTMAFSSLNGAVDVTLPAAVKANFKLRSDNGSVFTDFDLKMIPQGSSPAVEDTRGAGGRYHVELNRVIYGSVNGGGPDIEMRSFNGSIYLRKGK